MRASPRRRIERPGLTLRAATVALVIAMGVAACGGTSSPAPPSSLAGVSAPPSVPAPTSSVAPSPVAAASGWSVASVEQPAAVGAAASGAAPGLFCSPCHSAVTTYVNAVAPGGPGLVAVGLVFPGTYAAAWTSTDGLVWARTPDLGTEGTRAFAVSPDAGGLVAVGDQGHVPAAWWSRDGRTWGVGSIPAVPAGGAGQMLAVAGSRDGDVAGGWLEGSDGRSTAAIWTSPDGRAWTAGPPPPAGVGAQVHGLASGASAVVAVGVASAPGAGGAEVDRAAAWVSPDGRAWRAATIDGAAGSRMEAVIATPSGWLAVGSRDGALSAASWTSTDGLTWHAGPESPALRNLGGTIRMLGVAADGAGYVAAGWRDSAGNGNAVVWTSPDGRTWTRMPDDDSFSGGGMAGVTVRDGRIVAIGTVGWPDDHFATVWLHPVPAG